jgi:RNA polymerase sigma-70 factor (sigma-E family)
MERLGAWFAAEYPSLLRFAYLVSGERGSAEDLVQEAFVRLYRAGARTDDATVGAYARKAIVNLARSAHRRRATAERVVIDRPRSGAPPDVEARDELWNALRDLSPKQRAVVALRFYEDMSEREIAGALGISTGSVKKHADRAMTRLRAALGRES